MIPFEALERGWARLSAASVGRGVVGLIVVRTGDGAHTSPTQVELSPTEGIIGDRWLVNPKRAANSHVSFIDSRVAQLLVGGEVDRAHLPGDNFHVDLDLSVAALPVGTRLRLGTAIVEITDKPHAGCKKFEARLGEEALRWVNDKQWRARRLRGVYATIVVGGVVAVGDGVAVER